MQITEPEVDVVVANVVGLAIICLLGLIGYSGFKRRYRDYVAQKALRDEQQDFEVPFAFYVARWRSDYVKRKQAFEVAKVGVACLVEQVMALERRVKQVEAERCEAIASRNELAEQHDRLLTKVRELGESSC